MGCGLLRIRPYMLIIAALIIFMFKGLVALKSVLSARRPPNPALRLCNLLRPGRSSGVWLASESLCTDRIKRISGKRT